MAGSQSSKPKLIFDTDPGVDDVLALLLLLASSEAELALITVTFGNTTLQKAYTNVLKVYQVISDHLERFPDDQSRFPNLESRPTVCLGAATPLSGVPHLAEYFHGPDGLSDISSTHPEFDVRDTSEASKLLQKSDLPAEDAIIDLLLSNPDDSVTIVAVGPLTNIARAWTKNSQAIQRARRIIVMGGALDVPGNTSATAEFNFFADAQAATIIMDAAKSDRINLLLAPLDLTTRHGVPYLHLIHPLLTSGPLPSGAELSQSMSPLRAFTSVILHRVRRVTHELGLADAFDMHDPLAVWVSLVHAALPRDAPLAEGWSAERRDFVIERKGEYTTGKSHLASCLPRLTISLGMCIVDKRGGTDKTGGVRSLDGVQGLGVARSHPPVGVRVLNRTPGLAMMEKDITGKLFWDLLAKN